MKFERYVIVDTRTTCGNSVFFWCYDHSGYTVDLTKAGVYTEEEANQICNGKTSRGTDKLYPYSDMLKLVQHHIDIQDLHRYNSGELVLYPHTYSHLKPSEKDKRGKKNANANQ